MRNYGCVCVCNLKQQLTTIDAKHQQTAATSTKTNFNNYKRGSKYTRTFFFSSSLVYLFGSSTKWANEQSVVVENRERGEPCKQFHYMVYGSNVSE